MTLFVAMVAPVLFVAIAGLVFDAGTILNAKREAMDVAQEAARAGAQGLATEDVRQGQGGALHLDPARAEEAARRYLAKVGDEGSVSVEGDVVTVTVTVQRRARILPLGTTSITASAWARNVRGVVEAEA
ncbi:MAG TPA: pilus assembly protein TadG-related protein [Acidimicrobiales bacterium]|nr:pilus assembly protein TadG-related protein [Acidimicrobiales bacterium]